MPGADQLLGDLNSLPSCHHIPAIRPIKPHSTECLELPGRRGRLGAATALRVLRLGGFVPTTPPTSTPRRTMKRPPIPSPSRWNLILGRFVS
jgi:hypothetical protein